MRLSNCNWVDNNFPSPWTRKRAFLPPKAFSRPAFGDWRPPDSINLSTRPFSAAPSTAGVLSTGLSDRLLIFSMKARHFLQSRLSGRRHFPAPGTGPPFGAGVGPAGATVDPCSSAELPVASPFRLLGRPLDCHSRRLSQVLRGRSRPRRLFAPDEHGCRHLMMIYKTKFFLISFRRL